MSQQEQFTQEFRSEALRYVKSKSDKVEKTSDIYNIVRKHLKNTFGDSININGMFSEFSTDVVFFIKSDGIPMKFKISMDEVTENDDE